MLSSISFIVLLATLTPASAVFEGGRLLRGNLKAQSVASSNLTQDLKAWQSLGDSCKCSFSGKCSCGEALEFMQCIRSACTSGSCDCGNHHFFYACHTFSAECPSTGLKCTATQASCQPVNERAEMDYKVPKAASAKEDESDGNAESEKEDAPKVAEKDASEKEDSGKSIGSPWEHEEEFPETDADLVKAVLGGGKGSGGSHTRAKPKDMWKGDGIWEGKEEFPETDEDLINGGSGHHRHPHSVKEVPKDAAVDQDLKPDEALAQPVVEATLESEASHFWRIHPQWLHPRNWPGFIVAALVNIVLALLCAWIYNKYRFHPKLLVAPKPVNIKSGRSGHCTCGNTFLADSIYCRHCGVKQPFEDNFGVGLFSCFSDIKLLAFVCCCPCLRWADTMDRTGLQTYWGAIIISVVLGVLAPYTFGITGLLLVVACFRQRRRLRRKYNVAPNNFQDCLAYLCCSTCAVVQEARVQANTPF